MKAALIVALAVGGMMAGAAGSAKAGDQETACAAILCLAAVGSTPSECIAPLRKYYSLSASSLTKLKKKRRNFLNLCPTGEPELVNSLVSGRCNSAYQDCAAAAPGTPGQQHASEVDR